MNEKLEAIKKELIHKKRFNDEDQFNEIIRDLDLFKVYSSNAETNREFPYFDYNKNKAYKYDYPEFTEGNKKQIEEIIELKKSLKLTEESVVLNPISTAMKVIGFCIYGLGVISFTVALVESTSMLAFSVLIAAFVQGTIFLGFSEIIRLLQNIQDRQV